MGTYLLGRLVYALVAFFIISVVSFVLIQAPPGDYLTSYITRLQGTGLRMDAEQIENLKAQYGLDRPLPIQYLRWMGQIFRGNLGRRSSIGS